MQNFIYGVITGALAGVAVVVLFHKAIAKEIVSVKDYVFNLVTVLDTKLDAVLAAIQKAA